MERHYAFIDEYGDYGFNFDNSGTSTLFIVTAIIVTQEKLGEVELQVELIRKKYFGNGEIKSNRVGKDHRRRKMILADLAKSDFKFFALIVDKRKLYKQSGLRLNKRTFYKYINDRLHTELRRIYPRLCLVSDQHGTKEYMNSFREYVMTKTEIRLFDYFDFGFGNSNNTILVQLADFISGCLAYVYDEKKISEESSNYKSLLRKKQLLLEFWPPEYSLFVVNALDDSGKYNQKIGQLALRLANEFISKNEKSEDMLVTQQVLTLKYLRFHLTQSPDRYIPTKEIMNHLGHFFDKGLNIQHLRTKIIAKLRDAGVIIASSTKGYKLPVRESEIYDFMDHASTVIVPMLQRVNRCRETIKAATNGELDVLDMPQYKMLRIYLGNQDR